MGLSFLSPMLLGGAALVAVPFVLHLIMRRKPVKREFPALRFLKARATANRRRLRLNHLFLLLLRMAALSLLALALARPTLRGAGWLADGEGPVAAVFVFQGLLLVFYLASLTFIRHRVSLTFRRPA